jgi:hypothetical protein
VLVSAEEIRAAGVETIPGGGAGSGGGASQERGRPPIKLKTWQIPIEVRRQVQGQDEGEKRNQKRKPPDFAVAPRGEHQQQRTHCRSECDQRQNVLIQPVHRVPTQTM